MPQPHTDKVYYRGSVYESDGKNIWKNGVCQDLEFREVKNIEKIDALKLDTRIYYNEKWYVEEK